MRDTESLDVSKKTKQKVGSNLEHLPVLSALCTWEQSGQNAGTIHASNPEHFLFLRLHMGRSGTERGDNPRVQFGTSLFT